MEWKINNEELDEVKETENEKRSGKNKNEELHEIKETENEERS